MPCAPPADGPAGADLPPACRVRRECYGTLLRGGGQVPLKTGKQD
ncbi:hypothetical protein [Novosphingobium humi]|uniref:Uncharacterized protein n=1 Tax=Novosphingobium humi TaxID=2282397 RepID=A0ABY7U2S1_9SPHN|nr:hypothetical protein [Novosphingobium humi]WCT79410.1 hypothetical protein PQ457_20670 [Novosphingobium humi]